MNYPFAQLTQITSKIADWLPVLNKLRSKKTPLFIHKDGTYSLQDGKISKSDAILGFLREKQDDGGSIAEISTVLNTPVKIVNKYIKRHEINYYIIKSEFTEKYELTDKGKVYCRKKVPIKIDAY